MAHSPIRHLAEPGRRPQRKAQAWLTLGVLALLFAAALGTSASCPVLEVATPMEAPARVSVL